MTELVPRASRVVCGLVVAMCVVVAVALVAQGDVLAVVRAAPALALASVGSVALFWLPRVRIDPARLEIVNVLRTYRITWPAIQDVSAQWSLTVDTTKGRVSAWAAPAPGPLGQLGSVRRDERFRLTRESNPRMALGHLAPALIQRQWESYRDRGLLGMVEGDGVEVRWHSSLCAVLAVLVVLTVVAAAV